MFVYPVIPLFGAFLLYQRTQPSPFVPGVPERKKRKTPSEPPAPPVRRKKKRPVKKRKPIIKPPPTKRRKPTTIKPPLDPKLRLSLAKELAGSVARDIRRKKYRYNKQQTANFQRVANLKVDGLYGGGTAGAVQYYTRMPPPKPLLAPFRVRKFIPRGNAPKMAKPIPTEKRPGELSLLDATVLLANESAKNIRMKGRRYNKKLLRAFQKGANITQDGLYGGGTAGAIKYYTKRTPPRPLYKPTKVRPFKPRGKAPRF